jgi:integrase
MPFPSHDLTFRGRTLPITTWAEETGIPAATIRSRLFRLGWPVERALATRPNKKFSKGGRKRADAARPCPELKEHADGRAYCRWSAHGKPHWASFGPWGSDEAKRAYRRFALEWAAGQTAPPERGAGATVGSLVVRWLEHCARTYRKRDKPTSEVHCNRAAMRPLAELYGHEPAAEFGPPKLRAVREAMVERGWVRDTINAHVQRVVRAFAWGVTEQLVPVAVHEALIRLEPLAAGRRGDVGEGDGVPAVPVEHVEAVLAGDHLHADPARRAVLAAAVRVQLLRGMRPGEVCGLSAEGIERAREPWRCELVEFNKMLHKDVKRVVFFGPRARAVLAPLIAERPTGPLFVLPPARKGAAPTPLTREGYQRYIAAACARAGVPPWAPNQLRHTRATELMDAYEDDKAVAAELGNTPEVARQIYADRAGESVARRIAEATG